jgi:hypothetical protein
LNVDAEREGHDGSVTTTKRPANAERAASIRCFTAKKGSGFFASIPWVSRGAMQTWSTAR